MLEHDQYHASQEMFFLFIISWIVFLLGGQGGWGWGGKAGTLVMADVLFAVFPSAFPE